MLVFLGLNGGYKTNKNVFLIFVTLGWKLPETLGIANVTWYLNMTVYLRSSMLTLPKHSTFLLILIYFFFLDIILTQNIFVICYQP